MTVKIIKPAPGWAYAEGMTARLDEAKAALLIDTGYAVPLPDEPKASDLPDDFPARELLIREGLYTREKVRAAIPVLHEIRGIGSRTVEAISNRLK